MSTTRIRKKTKATEKTVQALMALKKGKTDPLQIPVCLAKHIISFIDTSAERKQIQEAHEFSSYTGKLWSGVGGGKRKRDNPGKGGALPVELALGIVVTPFLLMADAYRLYKHSDKDKGLVSLELFDEIPAEKNRFC